MQRDENRLVDQVFAVSLSRFTAASMKLLILI